MKIQLKNNNRRFGAALVEMTFVAVLFFIFLFGIVEYCRYIFYLQVMDNAAREGARYAVVNTQEANLETETKNQVLTKMVGLENGIENFQVKLYRAEPDGTQVGNADGAEFGEFIIVQVEGDYSPILPSFLFMGNSIHIQSKALMNSEAN